MPDKKPEKPSQFTESFAFIQSLFDEPESVFSKAKRRLSRVLKILGLVLILLLLLTIVWVVFGFDLTALIIDESGLYLPKR